VGCAPHPAPTGSLRQPGIGRETSVPPCSRRRPDDPLKSKALLSVPSNADFR
jgi:hypothetical protein